MVASTLDTWFRCRLPYYFGATTLASILASIFADWTPERLAAPTLMLRHLALCFLLRCCSLISLECLLLLGCFYPSSLDCFLVAWTLDASILCPSMLASMLLAYIARMLACLLAIRRRLASFWSLGPLMLTSMLASMLASMLLAYIARMLACFYPSSPGCFLVAWTLDDRFDARFPCSL